MLILLLDMVVLWFLLNIFSDENWDDEKLKIFLMALAISLLGGLATGALVGLIGPFALSAYFAIGFIVFWAVGSLTPSKAAIAMTVFLVYKVITGLILTAIFPE